MSNLERQVVRAQQRLTLNRFLDRAVRALLAVSAAWAVALIVDRAFSLGMPMWPSAAVAGGVLALASIVGVVVGRVSRLQAAVVLDRAAGAKERLSSALATQNEADPFAKALAADAEKVAQRIHVPGCVVLRAPQLWPWSLAMTSAAVLVAVFMPQLDLLAALRTDDELPPASNVERQTVATAVNEQLAQVRQMAEKNPALKELAAEVEPLKLPNTPTSTPDDIRREAVKKLDSVAAKLAEHKDSEELNALRETQRRMAQMNTQTGNQPTAQLSQSLARGDFEGARKALDQLKKELEEAAQKGDPAAQQKLAEMRDQLKKLSDELKQLAENNAAQKELEHKAGLSPEQAKALADKLSRLDPKQIEKELQKALGDKGLSQQQLQQLAQKMAEQMKSMQQCQGLGKAMAQAAQAMQKSGAQNAGSAAAQAASAALGDASAQLSQMEMTQQMMNELEANLASLKDARQGMCKGGNMTGDPRVGSGKEGYGRGFGIRPDKERSAHEYRPTKADVKLREGQIIGQMLVDGPQVRGEATAAVQEAVNSAVRDATDAVERNEVPRQYEGVLRHYFESLAGLVKPPQGAENPAPGADSNASGGKKETPAEKPE